LDDSIAIARAFINNEDIYVAEEKFEDAIEAKTAADETAEELAAKVAAAEADA